MACTRKLVADMVDWGTIIHTVDSGKVFPPGGDNFFARLRSQGGDKRRVGGDTSSEFPVLLPST